MDGITKTKSNAAMKPARRTLGGTPESICWSCKRATGNPDLQCPWVRDFRPVKGWDAKPTVRKSSSGLVVHSYCVDECPLYRQSDKWLDYPRFLETLQQHFGISRGSLSNPVYTLKKMKEWEKDTGEKIPRWIKAEAKARYNAYIKKQEEKALEKWLTKEEKKCLKAGFKWDKEAAIAKYGREVGVLK